MAVSQPVYQGSPSHGAAYKPVTVLSVDTNARVAIVQDSFGKNLSVRCDIMRAKGNLPAAGEQWIIDRQYGQWVFGAIINGATTGVIVPAANVPGLPEYQAGTQHQIDTTNATIDQKFLLRPTGDIEPTIRKTAKPGTLVMDGTSYWVSDYQNLWNWANAQGLVMPVGTTGSGLFITGDPAQTSGTAWFITPNWKGRYIMGADTGASPAVNVGDQFGSNTWSQANMPAHTHGVTVDAHGDHVHPFNTNTDGGHGGHVMASVNQAGYAPTADPQWVRVSGWGVGASAHTHGGVTAGSGQASWPHVVHETSIGGGASVDNRPSSVAINWLIWT